MNKNELVARFTSDEDEKILLCRVLDKYNSEENGGYMTSTVFLTDRQQILAERLLSYLSVPRDRILFDGGYDGASRKVLSFLPEYLNAEDVSEGELSPIAFVRASYYKDYSLTHRDFLGALTGDGVSREGLGDILVNDSEHFADIIVSRSLLNYMTDIFNKAGRASISVTEIKRGELFIPEQKTELIKDTVASLRLDGVVSAALGMSRDNAATAVSKGLVELNHFPCSKGEKQLSEGDAVSVRGVGKFILEKVGGISKKGRIFIEIKRFL